MSTFSWDLFDFPWDVVVLPYVAEFFHPSGVPRESQLVLTDGWWMVDGGRWMGSKKVLWFCSKFCQMKFTAYKFAVFWKICEKNFLSEKKSDLKFENRAFFVVKKVSLIFFIEIIFRWKKIAVFSKIYEKRFLSEKNLTSSFKIGGIFRKKSSANFLKLRS